MQFSDLLKNRLRRATPKKSALLESIGYFILGFGIFLALSIMYYSASDWGTDNVQNLAGPVGASLAHFLIKNFGVVSVGLPAGFCMWGTLVITGFITKPRTRRIVAFFLLMFVLAGLAHITDWYSLGLELPFGKGGEWGARIATALKQNIGYGGAIILLSILSAVTLVLTGNIAISNTAMLTEYVVYMFKRKVAHNATDKVKNTLNNKVPRMIIQEKDLQPGAMRTVISDETIAGPQENFELHLDLNSESPRHNKADLNSFKRSNNLRVSKRDFNALSEKLTEELKGFKIDGKVTRVTEGPIVTTFEFEPSIGTKVSKIVGVGGDLARLLKTRSLRVIAPIPGKSTVGFEIPNAERNVIHFGNLIDHASFKSKDKALPIVMGVDTFGSPIFEDLADMPHLLVAGSTGSGKSVYINTAITSLLCRHRATDLRLILIDPKMVELGAFNRAPHMACPVVTDPKKEAMAVLNSLAEEMDNRYTIMNALGAKNIQSFNETIKNKRKTQYVTFEGKWRSLPYIVLVIDEFADIILVLGKEAEEIITRLAQKARAAGIHLIIATQRPSVQVMTGLIKANFPTRVAFRVLSGVDSRTILDHMGAETLLGKGDMIYQSAKGMQRLHSSYLDESEVDKFLKSMGGKSPKRFYN